MDKVARDRILELRRADPLLTLRQIAERVGVTRQRVQQILADDGMATIKGKVLLTCAGCGNQFVRKRKDAKRAKKSGLRHFFCSSQCSNSYHKKRRII